MTRMNARQNASQYEIDRQDESQAIVVRHIEDESNGQPLLWGLVSYVILLPALAAAMMMTPLF